MTASCRFGILPPLLVALAAALSIPLLPAIAHATPPHHHHRATLGGPPAVAAPVQGNPVSFLDVPGGSVHALMPDGSIRNLTDGKTVMEVVDEDPEYGVGNVLCAVAEGPKFACLYVGTKTRSEGQSSYTQRKLVLLDSDGKRETIASGGGDKYSVTGLGIHLHGDGPPMYAYSETVPSGDATKTTQYLVRDRDRAELVIEGESFISFLAKIGGGDRYDAPIQFVDFKRKIWMVYRAGTELAVRPLDGEPVIAAPSTLHDIRPVVASDGWLYVFYHDPRAGTAHVAATKDGTTFKDIQLDGRESGWQLEASAYGERVYVVYYFFRNSFHKGLRAAVLRDGRVAVPAFTIEREEAYNTGWHPHFAIGNDGTTWLTYLQNVEDEKRVWSRFDDPAKLADYALDKSEGWEEGYKDYFLQAGVGGWMTWWGLADGAPKAEDTPGVAVPVGKTHYSVGRAILASANFEARYGGVDVGLSYAQSIVDDATKNIENKSHGVLSGNIKLEDVFVGHDMKLALVWGRYRGRATAGSGMTTGLPELPLNTNYVDLQFLLLNKWRIKYGLAYTTYTIPAAVHAWTAPQGSTTYTYDSSHFRQVSVSNYDLIIGYSKLDYAAKYENHYNNVFLDLSGGIGLSLLKFDEPVPTQLGPTSRNTSMDLRATGQLGWLFFHRWQSANGFGIYLRPAYTVEVDAFGSASKPSERKSEDTKNDSIIARPSITSLRHGPWFDIGVVL